MRRIAIITLLTLAMTTVAPIAEANYFGLSGGDGCCRFPDNAVHTIHFDVVPNASYRDAMQHGFDHLNNGTVISTKKISEADAGWRTDIYFIADSTYAASVKGLWQCQEKNDAEECERAKVFLNRPGLDGEGMWAKKHVSCHELGHSVGLDHANKLDSCMEQGLDEPRYYKDHDKNHLDSRW